MTKLIPILSGRCLVVELPENYTLPEIISNYWRDNRGCDRLRWSCPRPYGGWLKTMQRRLPPGNWRIIGMLSEVTEEQIIPLVDWESNPEDIGDEWRYRDYQVQDEDYKYSHHTALESLESAIEAEGWTFSNPYGMERPPNLPIDAIPYDQQPGYRAFRNTKPHLPPNDIELSYEFYFLAWQKAQSRVLDRSRCLLLGRESN